MRFSSARHTLSPPGANLLPRVFTTTSCPVASQVAHRTLDAPVSHSGSSLTL